MLASIQCWDIRIKTSYYAFLNKFRELFPMPGLFWPHLKFFVSFVASNPSWNFVHAFVRSVRRIFGRNGHSGVGLSRASRGLHHMTPVVIKTTMRPSSMPQLSEDIKWPRRHPRPWLLTKGSDERMLHRLSTIRGTYLLVLNVSTSFLCIFADFVLHLNII